MPIVNGQEADHHVYVVPDIVDGRVVAEQAIRRVDKLAETTYVHHHPKHHIGKPQVEENVIPCIGYDHDYYTPSPTAPVV